jgi:hypothetical protein
VTEADFAGMTRVTGLVVLSLAVLSNSVLPAQNPIDRGTPGAPAGSPSASQLQTVVLDDVPLSDAIRAMARQAGLNVVLDPNLTSVLEPNLSIRLTNVTAQDVLQAILEQQGLRITPATTNASIALIAFKDAQAEARYHSTARLRASDGMMRWKTVGLIVLVVGIVVLGIGSAVVYVLSRSRNRQ